MEQLKNEKRKMARQSREARNARKISSNTYAIPAFNSPANYISGILKET
jgi:hypothetical protein